MANDLGPSFCGTCGDTFMTTAALNAHQLETGHEMDQADHPLRTLVPEEPAVYRPAAGHRIIVRRTPGNHHRTGVMTGLVLDVLTIEGVPGILHFQCDQGGRVYLATNQQMAEIGIVQTIERLPDDEDEPDSECDRGDCLGIHRASDGYRDCDGKTI